SATPTPSPSSTPTIPTVGSKKQRKPSAPTSTGGRRSPRGRCTRRTPPSADRPLLHLIGAPMSLSEMYHVGIVVPDLDAAQARFSELLGVEWGPVAENDIEVQMDGSDLVVPNRICYSTRAPYLELIQEVPGTPWVCNEYSNLHHIGFFTDALVADSDGLRT